jgi:hypothetical protein
MAAPVLKDVHICCTADCNHHTGTSSFPYRG